MRELIFMIKLIVSQIRMNCKDGKNLMVTTKLVSIEITGRGEK